MVDPIKLKKPFYVNGVLVDPMQHTVSNGRQTRKISPRALNILKCLIQSEGEFVTYQQLADEVWKCPTTENAVYQQVTGLRKLLGDDSNSPAFIRTLPKRGYQLVAKLNFPDGLESTAGVARNYTKIGALLALAAVVLGALLFFNRYAWHAAFPKQTFLDAVSHLNYPEQVVGLEMADGFSDVEALGLLKSIELIAEEHLDQNRDLHVVHVPQSADHGWQDKLLQHFSGHGEFRYLLRPFVQQAGDGAFVLGLTFVDPATHGVVSTVSVPAAPYDALVATGLSDFERQFMQQAQALQLIEAHQSVFLTDGFDQNKPMVDAAAIVSLSANSELTDMQQALSFAQQALDANQRNLVAYSLFWDTALSLIQFHRESLSDVNGDQKTVDEYLKLLRTEIDKASELYPGYYKAYYVMAEYHYWMQDYGLSARSLSKTLAMKPYSPKVLLALSWHLRNWHQDSINVDRLNYDINPFEKRVVTFYRHALLASNETSKAVALLNSFASWDAQPKDWHLEAQTHTTYAKLEEFADWYRANLARIDDSPEAALKLKQANRGVVPSKYIGYMLLNANRPDLARFWFQHGQEDRAIYYDMRIIDVLADAWMGGWQTDKWRALANIASERRDFINVYDKLNMMYFYYYSGMLDEAERCLLEVFPDFADFEFEIKRDNFRYAVYYSEIQSRKHRVENAKHINQNLKNYLSSFGGADDRDVDFGIADIEFYALTGERDKALKLLRRAVEDGWLPNAFWQWPPLPNNPFLAALKGAREFDELNLIINRKLSALCFEPECARS